MFPPPQPWKQLAAIDPDQEYLAFTSRFAMRSFLRVPAFIGASFAIMKQVEAAPGVVGYSLGSHLPGLYFYTLSAWQNDESLRSFSRALQHGQSLKNLPSRHARGQPFPSMAISGAGHTALKVRPVRLLRGIPTPS